MEHMIPLGYMYKRVAPRTEWLRAPQVNDIYSLSGCVSEFFDHDYVTAWRHNGYWLYDSPSVLQEVAARRGISLDGLKLFYYEAYDREYAERQDGWRSYSPESSFETKISAPTNKKLEGFDVVTFAAGTSPECSPLSCNSSAERLPTNEHCLFQTFEEARLAIESKRLHPCEPGPYRIVAVYSIDGAQK